MDKQNILSQEQQGMNSTQNLLTLNQLIENDLDSNQKQDQKNSSSIIKENENKTIHSQNKQNSQNVKYLSKQDIKEIQNNQNSQSDQGDMAKHTKSHQISQMNQKESENQILNQVDLSKMKEEEVDSNVISVSLNSDLTRKKKIQSLFNRNLAKKKLFQNAVIQVHNFKEAQNAIVTYENNENKICHQCLSTTSNSNDTSKQQKSNYQNSQTQTFRKGKQKTPYTMNNEGDPSNNEQIIQNVHDKKSSNDFLITLEQDHAKYENQEMIFDNLVQSQNSYIQNQSLKYGYPDMSIENTQKSSNQFDQPQLDIFVLLEAQNKINQLQIENQLKKSYAHQTEQIINQIKELNIIEKELDKQKFEKINENQYQSKTFQDQKAKILQKLNENGSQLSKIVISHDKQTLVLGYQNIQELTDENNIEIISFIYHNVNELEQACLNQIFKTSQIKFDQLKIDQDNIQIFIIKKKDFEVLIKEKFKLLTKFESINQINDQQYQINSINYPLSCKKCQNENFCDNYECFQNIKARIITFLQFKKYFYCEYKDQIKEGLNFFFNQEELITFYTNFVYKLIFGFLEKEEANQQQISNENQQIQKISEQPKQLNISKQINNLQIVNEYQFKEYLASNKLDMNGQKKILNQQKRQWDISKFISINLNEVSEMFKREQNNIIPFLKEKKYYLCKSFISNINEEDIFIGYQEEVESVYTDFVFVIKYSPLDSEIQKYLLIQQFNEPIIHFIIKNYIHILILSKDSFLQIQNNFEYIKQIKNYWTKDYFEIINKDKAINQKNCNNCEDCEQKQQCSEYLTFRQFQEYKDSIFKKLVKKNYYICEYLSKGGEGLIFKGYSQTIYENQEVVFKILLDCDEDELQNEIKIMKIFDQNISVIKFIDHIKINNLIHILVLEKCQFSLYDELNQINQQKIFPLEKLLQMIFNLLDGLIQFRIYNILHLDIKPQNILVTKSGQYVFTDFGMSSLKKDGQIISFKGYTKKYAAPEQLQQDDENINYKSDIYSLGITFQIILKSFEDIQKQKYSDFISKFKVIIGEKMVLNQSNKRLNCLELSKEFFQEVLQQQICSQFLNSYIPQIDKILKSYPFDKNKEIPYFLQISLFYSQNILQFYQSDIIQTSLLTDKYILQYQISLSMNNVGLCYKNLGDNKKVLEYQLQSLQMLRQIFKEDHPDIAAALNNIGLCYENLGDNQKALEYYLESLQMKKQIFKQDHPDIAVSLDNIGNCYENLGNNKKALEYKLESLKMKKQIFKEDHHPSIATSLNNVGIYYLSLGDYKKALQYFLESLQIFRQIFKEDHPDIATILNNLGSCYQNLGDNKKALEYLLESLQMFQLIFKQDHPLIAKFLNNVGNCYQNLGNNKKALEYCLESLQMFRQIFKEDHPDIATSLNNVGICYQNLGDNKKALEYQLQSLQILQLIFKEDHPLIAKFLNNVGNCYQNLGDNQKALEYQLESLQMTKQIFKEDHPSIATSLNNVGICYQNLGDNQKALEYFLDSLQMINQIFKEDHALIAKFLNNVGSCYETLGDSKKALEYLLESLKMTKQIFKEDHPDIATSLNNVGSCYKTLGDSQKALEYLLESLKMRKQIFEEDHPLIATSLNNVGRCYEILGDNKKALEYLLESLQMFRQIFKEDHPDIATSLNNVGLCYRDLGDNKKALEYQLESLQMRKQIFKEDHPDIATSLNNVGRCYEILGDNKKALEYLLESLQMFRQIFKEDHPDIATSLNNVGLCYKNLGDNKKALEYLLESLQMRKQIFLQDHPDIAQSLNNLGVFYKDLGDYKKAIEYLQESFQMTKQIFKEDHPSIAISLNNIGLCYRDLGDNKKALTYLLEYFQMKKQIFKENYLDNIDIAQFMGNVSICYKNLCDYKMSLEYLFEIIQMRKQKFKEDYPYIEISLFNIGVNYIDLGDYKKALEYFLESLQMSKLIIKKDHPLIAKALYYVELCYLYLGDKIISLEYEQEMFSYYF